MNAKEIQDKLRKIVEPYVEDKSLLDSVGPETDLLTDLTINSADLVDIILDSEEAFDIEIDDEAADKMLKVKDAVQIIAERIAS